MDQKTPLYDTHVDLGATMVPFAGFIMPVQYPKGILFEHRSVREKAGLFDVSHMGELHLTGKDALRNLNYLVSNDFTDLAIGKIRYGILLRKDGTAVDDLLVYHMDEDDYWIVVNASNIDKDFTYFTQNLSGGALIHNESEDWGQVALQGPLSEKILRKLTDTIPEAYYSFIPNVDIHEIDVLISGEQQETDGTFDSQPYAVDALVLGLRGSGKSFTIVTFYGPLPPVPQLLKARTRFGQAPTNRGFFTV